MISYSLQLISKYASEQKTQKSNFKFIIIIPHVINI